MMHKYITATEMQRVLDCVQCIQEVSGVDEAHIVGGALLRQDSKDIDVLVKTTNTTHGDAIYETRSRLFRKCSDFVNTVNVFYQYGEDDSSKDCIIKVGCRHGRGIDLLLTNNDWVLSDKYSREVSPFSPYTTPIVSYMERYFPLSIQCIALNIHTGEINTSQYHDAALKCNTILVKKPNGDDTSYIDKYKEYYPGVRFKYV